MPDPELPIDDADHHHDDNDASSRLRVTVNLRFPGQYYDRETGFFYNANRYYNPKTGRYITSDPIGLMGGVNTNGYSGANALRYSDPTGLCLEDGCVAEAIGAGALIGGGIAFASTWYETDSFSAGLHAFPGGAVGGITMATTALAPEVSFVRTAAAAIFDAAVTAANDAWSAADTLNTSSTSGSGPTCPP